MAQTILLLVFVAVISLTVSEKCPPNGNWTFISESGKCIEPSPIQLPADMAPVTCNKSGLAGTRLSKTQFGKGELKKGDNATSLLSIASMEEMEGVLNYIKTLNTSLTGGLWIDGRRSKNDMTKFVTKSSFTNWENGYPSGNTSNECIAMNLNGPNIGKWRDVGCHVRNHVWCEMPANLTMNEVVADLRQKIAELKEKPFPPGYVYMQHANQPSPSNLWPKLKWEEVLIDEETTSSSLNETATTRGDMGQSTTARSAGRKRRSDDAEGNLTPAFATGRIWKCTM